MIPISEPWLSLETPSLSPPRPGRQRGESLERCRHGLPEWFPDNIDTFCLSASNLRAVIGTSDGQVFVSSDRGQSWDAVAERLPRILCVTLAKDA